jgi:hypothetical protein
VWQPLKGPPFRGGKQPRDKCFPDQSPHGADPMHKVSQGLCGWADQSTAPPELQDWDEVSGLRT